MSRLKNQLLQKLEQIPGLSHTPWPKRDDGFSTLHFGGKEIGHFHHFNELDLRLGKKLIKEQGLRHHSDSIHHPGRSNASQFIELRFNTSKDLDRIVELVKLLLKDLKAQVKA